MRCPHCGAGSACLNPATTAIHEGCLCRCSCCGQYSSDALYALEAGPWPALVEELKREARGKAGRDDKEGT